MTLILLSLSSLTSIIARKISNISKEIILISSILIVIPTLYD
jgi:hypothetical protein